MSGIATSGSLCGCCAGIDFSCSTSFGSSIAWDSCWGMLGNLSAVDSTCSGAVDISSGMDSTCASGISSTEASSNTCISFGSVAVSDTIASFSASLSWSAALLEVSELSLFNDSLSSCIFPINSSLFLSNSWLSCSNICPWFVIKCSCITFIDSRNASICWSNLSLEFINASAFSLLRPMVILAIFFWSSTMLSNIAAIFRWLISADFSNDIIFCPIKLSLSSSNFKFFWVSM